MGYTLIEVLVVISIIAIVSTASFLNIGGLRSNTNLQTAAHNLQSYLRVVQINATSGVKCNGTGGADWQLSFEAENTKEVSIKCQVGEIKSSSTKPILEGKTVSVKSVVGYPNCTSLTYPITISFSPIYNKINFLGVDSCLASSTKLDITIKSSSGEAGEKTVTVHKGGSIDIN